MTRTCRLCGDPITRARPGYRTADGWAHADHVGGDRRTPSASLRAWERDPTCCLCGSAIADPQDARPAPDSIAPGRAVHAPCELRLYEVARVAFAPFAARQGGFANDTLRSP